MIKRTFSDYTKFVHGSYLDQIRGKLPRVPPRQPFTGMLTPNEKELVTVCGDSWPEIVPDCQKIMADYTALHGPATLESIQQEVSECNDLFDALPKLKDRLPVQYRIFQNAGKVLDRIAQSAK